MSLDYIRNQYGVPAKKGARVEYTGDRSKGTQLGVVTGAQGGHVLIRIDGEKASLPYHPTWELKYLTPTPD